MVTISRVTLFLGGVIVLVGTLTMLEGRLGELGPLGLVAALFGILGVVSGFGLSR